MYTITTPSGREIRVYESMEAFRNRDKEVPDFSLDSMGRVSHRKTLDMELIRVWKLLNKKK